MNKKTYQVTFILYLISFLFSCDHPATESRIDSVIYDTDSRIEVYQETDETRLNLAHQSIVALITKSSLTQSGTTFTLTQATPTLNNYITFLYGTALCDDQRFTDQPAVSSCSGTLIDDDLVLTAGHCVSTIDDCQSYYFVFDYYYESDGVLAEIDTNDVYECEQVVAFELTESPEYLDYAIVKLDRPVNEERSSAPVDTTDDAIDIGTPITVMGFGSGIPLKIDSGGEVISSGSSSLATFEATPDTFSGNSGSGVFDSTGNVIGILVSGQEDYISRSGESCTEVNTLDPDIDSPVGETITYVQRAVQDLCDSGYPSITLCNIAPTCGDGFCTYDESLTSCEEDCSSTVCGDGECSSSETEDSCDYDCTTHNFIPRAVKRGRCSIQLVGQSTRFVYSVIGLLVLIILQRFIRQRA